ncbi:MAG: pyruvate kinase [Thermoplasmata archaeon]|nr:pyruvate kinase [Thermoplasmata archaeon]
MSARKAILCTLGPSSMDRETIGQLEAAGVTGFRINMSHSDVASLPESIRFIQGCTRRPICLDTEGAQIRTGLMPDGAAVVEGSVVRLVPEQVRGDGSTIPLTPGFAIERLSPSTRMSIDFDSVTLRIDRVTDGWAEATVVTGGEVGSRKAVTAFPSPRLPTFTEKDLLAIECARANGVQQYALSFCEHPSAVNQLRELVGPESMIVAKIESREGVRNLGRIAEFADAILVDRGDLSREVRLEAIPLLQKAILRKANALGIPAYVATNLLESMVARRAPTRAEVNDVMNTLLDGADGLVLAAETAIGKHPVEAVQMIASLLREYEGSIEGYRIDDLLGDHPLALARVSVKPLPEHLARVA